MAILEIIDIYSNSERRHHPFLSLMLTRVLNQGDHQSKMITAAGAGASFCLATPARLRPQNQRNPRVLGAGQASQTTLGNYNLQRTQSAASNYSQNPNSTYAPSINSPTRADRIPEVTEISKSRPFFPAPLSPPISHPVFRNPSFSASSAALYHDALLQEDGLLRPKSPGSLYSYNTTSSDATARQFSSISESLEPEEISDEDGEISPTSPAAPRQFPPCMASPLPGVMSRVHNSQLDLQAFNSNSGDLLVFQTSDSPTSPDDAHRISDAMTYSLDQSSQEICIVVLGMENSGKSTFIQKYNGPKRTPINGVSQRVYRYGDLRYVVRLVEMDLSALDIRSSNFTWPSLHDGTEIMTADGILVIFDVNDRTSLDKVPDVTDFFFKAEIPTILVASKCDSPIQMRDLQPEAVEELKHSLGVEVVETSSSDGGQSQKRCVSLMLSNIIQRKAEVKAATQANERRRTNSGYSARSVSPFSDPKPNHGRASSELSISISKTRDISEGGKGHHGRATRSLSASSGMLLSPSRTSNSTPSSPMSNIRAYTQDFNPSFGRDTADEDDFSYLNADHAAYSSVAANFLRSKSTSAASPHVLQGKPEHSSSLSEVIFDRDQALQRINSGSGQYSGVAWEDLVDRLLAYPMSRADQDFATVMLCFFRKFAAPVDLLDSILAKFERVSKDEPIILLQMNEKIRILSRLHWWVWECPGDFANSDTKQRTVDFARSLEGNRTFAGMAKDIIAILSQNIEDEDQIWGKKDTDSHRFSMPGYMAIHPPSSPTFPMHTTQPYLQPNAPPPRNMSIVSTLSFKSGASDDNSFTAYSPVTEKTRKDSYISNTSLSPTLDAQAGMMNISSLLDSIPYGQTGPRGVGEQYSIFMELPDEDIAHELTRIDWTMFSRIKPRDFVRHVSVPAAEKERMPSLKYMNKLIVHFNRVAYWVASIILERPKAKHRARALEKFMNIAWILRHMNNYNSLGAVIAGVNGLAIHRLTLTRSLVNEAIHKNFMRLELLMGTHKSHFAYRLALENTTTEHIPFIALHRKDLVSADEGNRSFLGDGARINWRKFEIMGDILLTVTNSQSMPHRDLRPNPMTNQLIFDATGTINDDQLMEGFSELYERSVLLEPGNHMQDAQRAKRGWFKR
ncbi:hypothetical protein TWF192_006344 [Orbilia oligospora]|uniref:Uncharacterized protein n=2 Tax=Orbilia oligospora TaxID=2813651 RepID=A0A6G1M8D9_ORBOL|nr:hypothetical protein TWF191_010793 [Orbilia oligospora]KAF3248351.1 hypothetical protein TWF192_006344 [Orbilia oligospora]